MGNSEVSFKRGLWLYSFGVSDMFLISDGPITNQRARALVYCEGTAGSWSWKQFTAGFSSEYQFCRIDWRHPSER